MVEGVGGRKGGEEEATADRAVDERRVEGEVAVVAAVRLRARDGANPFAMVGGVGLRFFLNLFWPGPVKANLIPSLWAKLGAASETCGPCHRWMEEKE